MTRRELLALAASALVLIGAGLYVAQNLRVTTGLTAFVASTDDPILTDVAARLAESPVARTLILSIGAPDLDVALAAARRWAVQLRSDPEVESLASGPPADVAGAARALLFPHRLGFLSGDPERELPERLSDAGLAQAAADLRAALLLPDGVLAQQTAAQDPLQAFVGHLRRIEAAASGGAQVAQGQFVSRDRTRAILFVTTVHSALDASHQAPLLAHIDASFAELARGSGAALTLERSGVHRFAVASESTARSEFAWLSGISLPAVILLFLAVFRSLRLLALALIPLLAGTLGAAAVTLAGFGELHVLTLVFGSTLIGICIDYPVHFLNHHVLSGSGDARASLRRVMPALLLGAGTTVAGFAGLFGSRIPGMQQVGVFSAVGIAVSVAATALLPPFVGARTAVPLHVALTRKLERALDALERRRRASLALWGLSLLVIALALPRLGWRDDVFGLGAPLEPSWLAEEARVRDSVSQMEPGRFVIAVGRNAGEALARNDTVHASLVAARESGELAGFRSLHDFLFSPDLQRRNLAALAASPELARRTAAAFAAQGFRPQAFEPFARALDAPSPAPLELREVLDSPLGSALRGFVIELPAGVAVLTQLRNVRDADALRARVESVEGVRYFDQQRFLADAYGSYRSRTELIVGLGLAGVLALVYLRYRRLRLALAAVAPALVACALTVSALALANIPLNLLHMLGLLLVLSLGVDYAIFLLEHRDEVAERGAAFMGVIVDCLSTVLSFGLLAASSFPALQSLGMATGLGVALSLAFAPGAVVLAHPAEKRP